MAVTDCVRCGGTGEAELRHAASLDITPAPCPCDKTRKSMVECDDNCGAVEDPIEDIEYRVAYEHWRKHRHIYGCAHGR